MFSITKTILTIVIFVHDIYQAAGCAAAARGGDDEKGSQKSVQTSAANRLIGEVVQSRRRPILGPSPG